MDDKKYLTNKAFCPIPWTGVYYNVGHVRNCTRKLEPIGNLFDNSIYEIINGETNQKVKENMLSETPEPTCHECYELERGKNSYDIISDRIYYLKELKTVPKELYDDKSNHKLYQTDVRWSTGCNHACVYCGPDFSTMWAKELNVSIKKPPQERLDEFKEWIFDNAKDLKQVYMAGGEPLLMKENLELLRLLEKENPDVTIRVNTNLSKTETRVFEKLLEFKNVHWTISVETMEEEFEYIRYGGNWKNFVENLLKIQQLDHKITFNMLWTALNPWSLFDCIEYLQNHGYHNNGFVIGPVYSPEWIEIRNLPEKTINELKVLLQHKIDQNPGYLLQDSYRNLLKHINLPWEKKTDLLIEALSELDQRRGIDSRKVFPRVYECLQD